MSFYKLHMLIIHPFFEIQGLGHPKSPDDYKPSFLEHRGLSEPSKHI